MATAVYGSDESVLSVRDLKITYRTQAGDVPAVRGIDLEIGRGEVLGLAGESGCGKSTVVNGDPAAPAGRRAKVEGSIRV